MASQRTHRLTVRVGEYTDASTQEKKTRSREIGSLFTDEEGHMFIRIHAEQLNPILASMARQRGDDQVIIGVWPAEKRQRAQQSDTAADGDDASPF